MSFRCAGVLVITCLSIILSPPAMTEELHEFQALDPPLFSTQPAPEADDESVPDEQPSSYEDSNNDWLTCLWGEPFRDHLYLGMWSYHFSPGDDQDANNQLIAASYKGYYAGTFYNTFSDRVWSLGVQRRWFQQNYGVFDVEVGYRAGMMYGYKKYLNLFDTRLFPLFQVVADIDYNGFGVELSWAGVVATVGFLYRF